MSRNTAASRALYELAAHQGGYFTARQAREAGYEDNVHPYHVRSRNWVREARGVYRLSQFPLPSRPDRSAASIKRTSSGESIAAFLDCSRDMTLLLRRTRAGRSAGPDVEQCDPDPSASFGG